MSSPAIHEDNMDTLIFQIGGQRYGLPAPDVRELFRAVTITAVPSGPALLEGVIDLRGLVVPVFDLRARLGLPPKSVEVADHLIVVEMQGRSMVLRADQALEMATITEGEIGYVGDVVPGLGSSIKVAKRPEGLVLLLDLETLVSPRELATIEENLSSRWPPAGEEAS
ncbi:chemotaxis protein CheW [soil metagenome]